MLKPNTSVCVFLGSISLAACSSREASKSIEAASVETKSASTSADPKPTETEDLNLRLARLDKAVTRWQEAPSLSVAYEAAEEARNLVVGEAAPLYGDANRDGKISGANSVGVLPSLEGEAGLAQPGRNACIDADVLGGSWSDPATRWSQLQAAIRSWRPQANTFPSLASHPQRVVGWASLTLNSSSLAEAHEYAGHARLHVNVSTQALHDCRR